MIYDENRTYKDIKGNKSNSSIMVLKKIIYMH